MYLVADCFGDLAPVSHLLMQCETVWQELNMNCSCCHYAVSKTGQGWTDIYMDMRLGLTEVTMLFMVFGSLVTRRKCFL